MEKKLHTYSWGKQKYFLCIIAVQHHHHHYHLHRPVHAVGRKVMLIYGLLSAIWFDFAGFEARTGVDDSFRRGAKQTNDREIEKQCQLIEVNWYMHLKRHALHNFFPSRRRLLKFSFRILYFVLFYDRIRLMTISFSNFVFIWICCQCFHAPSSPFDSCTLALSVYWYINIVCFNAIPRKQMRFLSLFFLARSAFSLYVICAAPLLLFFIISMHLHWCFLLCYISCHYILHNIVAHLQRIYTHTYICNKLNDMHDEWTKKNDDDGK